MFFLSSALAAELGNPLDRDRLVAAVLEQNPSLEALEASLASARAAVDAVPRLPDPMVETMLSPGGLAMGMVGVEVRVEQALPLWGMTRLERSMASASADSEHARLSMMRRDMARMAGMAWVDWWWMHAATDTMREELAAMRRMQSATLVRYAAGTATSLDTLAVEAESAAMEAELAAMERERDGVRARIAALLHEPDVVLPPPPPDLPLLPIPIESSAPEAAEGEAMVAMARTDADMARRARLPMLGWMVEWDGMREPADQVMAGVSVEVPLSGRARAAAIRAADARISEAEAEAEAMLGERRRQIDEARARLDGRRAELTTIETRLLPAARARVEAARSAYSAGTTSIGAVLDAEQAWSAARLRHVEARARVAIETDDLARLLGGAE